MEQPVNPYIVGPSVIDVNGVFGRQQILESIKNELHVITTKVIVLHGQRRIGKTTLLLQLNKTLLSENFVPIYFDMQYQAIRPLKLILEDLADAIAKKTKFEVGELTILPDDGTFLGESLIPNIYEHLTERQRLVFLFDEIDVLDQLIQEKTPEQSDSYSFFQFLRNWMSRDKHSAFVFAIGRRIEDLSLDFSETFKTSSILDISMLDNSSASDLIRQAETNNTLAYSDTAIERILSLTNGHPYFTQLLCQHIWDQAYAIEPVAKPIVKITDVDAVINDTISDGEHVLLWIWGRLNFAQKLFISALAKIAGEKSEAVEQKKITQSLSSYAGQIRTVDIRDAPIYLVTHGILKKQGNHKYSFAFELFFLWVKQKKPLEDVKKELEHISPLAYQLFDLGDRQYKLENWGEAAHYFRETLKEAPLHIRARIQIGKTYLYLSQYDNAISDLEQAYEFNPDDAYEPLIQALLARAESKEQSGDDDLVLADCRRILKIIPQQLAAQKMMKRILIRRGITSLEKKQFEQAEADFKQAGILPWENSLNPLSDALSNYPTFYHARLFLGIKLLDCEQSKEAYQIIDEALKIIYDTPGLEQENDVENILQSVLGKSPCSVVIRRRHGDLLLRLGQVDRAVTELEQAYLEDPENTREQLLISLLNQLQIARREKDWDKASSVARRLAQVSTNNNAELVEMADVITELQESLQGAQTKQHDKADLNELLLVARDEIQLLGVVPFEIDWNALSQILPAKLKAHPNFTISILCESDNILFSRALTTDIETAKKRQSYRELKFIRDHVLVDLSEALRLVGLSSSQMNIQIMHLPIPLPVLKVDGRIFVNLWLSEGAEEYFNEVTPQHPWYEHIQKYIEYCFDSSRGSKFASHKDDELLELFDHERIPRGIYPRSSFYDTDYDQLVVWGFIFDRKGRLLIHRRSDNAKDNQGMWDKSVGGHTDLADFDTSKAIPREVIEELFSEELKLHKSNFTAFSISDEDMVFMGDWRPERRKKYPFDEMKKFTREWAYFRVKEDQRLYSPRILPTGLEHRLRVIADVFLFLAGPQLTDESLVGLKNSKFKLIDLAELKIAMDKSMRNQGTSIFEEEPSPRFSPDLVNVMTGKLRDVLDEFSQHIKKYIR